MVIHFLYIFRFSIIWLMALCFLSGQHVVYNISKSTLASSYVNLSRWNFSDIIQSNSVSRGNTRYTTATASNATLEMEKQFLICRSKRISPKMRNRRVKSNNFIILLLMTLEMLCLRLHFRRRLYLSTKQQRRIPKRETMLAMGISEAQKMVNHMVFMIYAQRLPRLYQGYYISQLAYDWVKSSRPQFNLTRTLWIMYQGLISQTRGANRAFSRLMKVSYSTTPQWWAQLLKTKASTASVRNAVVKNIPNMYFKEKLNSSDVWLMCFSQQLMWWYRYESTNLLKRVIRMMARQPRKIPLLYISLYRSGSSLQFSTASSIRWDFPLMMQNKIIVNRARTTSDTSQPSAKETLLDNLEQ